MPLLSVQMDRDLIDSRIERALAANGRAERVIVWVGLAIALFGIAVMGLAYWQGHPVVAAGTGLLQCFLWYPISEMRQLRRERRSLQAVPTLIASLPPHRAMDEICTLLAFIRGEATAPAAAHRTTAAR